MSDHKIEFHGRDLFIHNEYATTHELDSNETAQIELDLNNCLRVYKYSPYHAMIQVRAKSKLNPFGKGKERYFYSGLTINADGIDALITHLQDIKSSLTSEG
ncbi:MAG: hypothetical protein ACR2P1_25635 [Pseudomonadales bacterium]